LPPRRQRKAGRRPPERRDAVLSSRTSRIDEGKQATGAAKRAVSIA